MNINECGCRPYGWLGLDGDRCIRVIPRQEKHNCILPDSLFTPKGIKSFTKYKPQQMAHWQILNQKCITVI